MSKKKPDGMGAIAELLAAPLNNAERQKQFNRAKRSAGLKSVAVWLSAECIEELKQRFPGPRGGIDWLAVVARALL